MCDFELHPRFDNVPLPTPPPTPSATFTLDVPPLGPLEPVKELPSNSIENIAAALPEIKARAVQAGAGAQADALAKDIGLLVSSLEAGQQRFFPAVMPFNATIFNHPNPTAVIDSIAGHLVEMTVAAGCYATEAAARRDVEVFCELYLNRVSHRALRTLYAGYCLQTDVSIEYLRAIEAITDDDPIQSTEATEIIYFKFIDADGVLEKVIDVSERPDVVAWAKEGLERKRPSEEAEALFKHLWGDHIPFPLFDERARVFQVGRKLGNPLSSRDKLDKLAIACKPVERQSYWLTSRGVSGKKPTYFALLRQTDPSVKRRRLEQRAAELFFGVLVRSPLSSMHRRPSDDLYRLELHPSPTDEYNDGLIDGEGDDEDEPVIRVAEIPSHTKLMKRWRDILGAFLSHNGVQHGEVDIECLHWLGYQGEDLAPFIRDRYQAQSPYGAICLGFGIPFALEFKVTSDLSLRSMQGGFAIAYDETTKRLAIRPLSYLKTRELPRVPFWPRTMASCRVPTQMSWTLGIDTTAGQGWTAVRQQALDEGSVRVAVVLTPLPSGHSTLALPGEGPGLLKTRHLAYNGDGTIPGARFAKVHLAKEARSLLMGESPEPIRVRDLDVWHHVSEIAPLRGAETTNVIGKPGGPAILSNIQDYIAEPPSPEGEYESTGVDNLFDSIVGRALGS